jgi:hypothetical protein
MDGFSISDLDQEETCEFLKQPRFIDLRSKEAEYFNNFLDSHIPSEVIRWGCYEDIGWVFELDDLVLDVENHLVDSVNVRVTSGTMPRVYIDPLRQELRRMMSSR